MIKLLIKLYKENTKRNLTKDRYIMNTYVLMNVLLKFLTFLPAYWLNKLKVSPDKITLLSYISIIIAVVCFFKGDSGLGCFFMIFFGFLDSLDGDIARLKHTKSDHGQTMDIIGADLFYFLIPISICFNVLYYENIDHYLNEYLIIFVGFFISFSLILYRLIGLRNYVLFLKSKSISSRKKIVKKKLNIINKIFKIFEHDIIRGNFFSEPGFILNFSVLIILGKFQILYYYMFIILIYSVIRILKLFIGSNVLYLTK